MEENTNWGQSVTGIVICQGKVLLARHTYGTGKGKLIVPGGYVKIGETPQDALKREFLEETGVVVEPGEILAIRQLCGGSCTMPVFLGAMRVVQCIGSKR